jgi:hypothetical protein
MDIITLKYDLKNSNRINVNFNTICVLTQGSLLVSEENIYNNIYGENV